MSELKNIADIEINELDDKDVIRGFIATASLGLCHKEDVVEKCQFVEDKIDDLNSRLGELEDALCNAQIKMP